MYKNKLVDIINNQLKGALMERGCIWEIEWQIRKAMGGGFSKEHYQQITVDKDKHANYCVVRYKGYYLFSLKYTKQQGEYHCKYFSSYYDYYFKEFTSEDEDFDLEQKIYEIEIRAIDDQEKRENTFSEMVDNYKKIQQLFGNDTDRILDYINRNNWNIKNAIKNQER